MGPGTTEPATTGNSPVALLAALVVSAAACGERPAGGPGAAADGSPPAIVLEVDADGFFVSSDVVRGAWFAGFGMPCLLPPRGATDGQHLVGRIAGDAPVLISRRDGMLDSLRPTLQRVAGSHRERVRDAAAAADLSGMGGDVAEAFAAAVHAALAAPAPPVPSLPPPRAAPPQRRDAAFPAGTPLMAWAPPGTIVVHFRSVAAAYRFTDLADRLGGAVAAARGDGRDHGTLRLTLHHLLLPSIWKANPGGRKGVSECALIVAPPLRRGVLRAALVLRIVDPVLHDHETRAGVALETSAGHRRRPAGDPFPEERVRTAVRAVAGDCEVVATDAALLERVLAGPGRPARWWTPAAVAARSGLPAGDRSRAFTLANAAQIDVDAGAPRARALEGARRLAERWLGLAAGPVPAAGDEPRPRRVASPWSAVVAVVADTDAQGATVNVRLATDAAARTFSRLLPADGAQRACLGNLRELAPLGLVEPRASDPAERAFVWFGRRPVCPRGGAYRFHPVTGEPSCSLHGSAESDVAAPDSPVGAQPSSAGASEPAPWPADAVSDVRVAGSLVTFRLSIDW